MNVKLNGTEEVLKMLQKAGKLEAVKQVVKADGGSLQARAMRKAPVAPVNGGTLKRSISIELIDQGLTAKVEPHTDYAAYVEYGTRKMEAQPYMKPAYEQTVEEFKAHIKKVME